MKREPLRVREGEEGGSDLRVSWSGRLSRVERSGKGEEVEAGAGEGEGEGAGRLD